MTMINNPFSFANLVKDFNDVDNTIKATQKAINDVFDKAEVSANVPMNIIREEDDSWTIELAVVGKTKEDIRVYTTSKNNKTILTVEVKAPEQTESKRHYSLQKIKMGKMKVDLEIPATLDISKIKPSVNNGLLTIRIPLAETAKPTEFVVE